MAKRGLMMTGQSVLFVDDDVFTQWIMTEVLTDAGFDVVSACRGAEAVRLLTDAPDFDLLITDVDLPDNVGGTDLGQVWRSAVPGRPTLYTGTRRHPATRHLASNEFFLNKPFTPEMLLDLIGLALEEAVFRPAMAVWAGRASLVH